MSDDSIPKFLTLKQYEALNLAFKRDELGKGIWSRIDANFRVLNTLKADHEVCKQALK